MLKTFPVPAIPKKPFALKDSADQSSKRRRTRHSLTSVLLSLLLPALLLFDTLPALAQSQKPPQRFRGYPVLGMNASQVDGDNLAGFHKPGFHAGGGVFVMLDNRARMSLSMELLYNQKGARTRPGRFPLDKLTLNYLDLPLQFNYHDKERMIFSGGFSLGTLFGATRILDGIEQQDDIELYEPREFGYLVGATYVIQDHYGIGLRYSGSLVSFGESNNPLVSGLINRAVTFRASYIF